MSSPYIQCSLLVLLVLLVACKGSPALTPQDLPPPAPTEATTALPTQPPEPPQPTPTPPEPPAVVDCPIPDPPLIARTADAIVLLQPIVFDFNKAKIRPESFPILDQLAGLLSCDLSLAVVIEAHRDANPDMRHRAVEITRHRAASVRDALIRRGIEPSRLQSVGFGEDRPIVPNDSPENRAKNRRIELRILKNPAPPVGG